MNREILFRGKRVDNGEWVYGLLWKKKYNTNKIFISYFPAKDDREEVVVVVSETVGQFTGLLDKNGVKIFEGDILHCSHTGKQKERGDIIKTEEIYVVKFGVRESEPYELDEIIGWLAECKYSKHPLTNSLIFRDNTNPYWETIKGGYNLEVIGNTTDNPELLEVE